MNKTPPTWNLQPDDLTRIQNDDAGVVWLGKDEKLSSAETKKA